ncbi:hypothetical protein B0A54_17808 [Friedmanniomyces endolithicus]|uniref:Uncharacterized protein n=1 Tax=Friedmanniomyces endolithicus TaxID=329885 RepID=A0A4U0TPL4_9PEZI|nr:hypothetical protein B0A54_17808 [Friedmanniomyces endolithicus]
MSHFANNLAPVDIVPRPQSQLLFDTQVQSSPYQPTSQFHQQISQPVASLGSNLAGYNDRMDPTMGRSALTSPDQINQRLAKLENAVVEMQRGCAQAESARTNLERDLRHAQEVAYLAKYAAVTTEKRYEDLTASLASTRSELDCRRDEYTELLASLTLLEKIINVETSELRISSETMFHALCGLIQLARSQTTYPSGTVLEEAFEECLRMGDPEDQ